MPQTGSVSVITGTTPDSSSRFGLVKSGAAWAEARAVLICVHGRDREPSELPALLADHDAFSTYAILSPHIRSRCWYSARYDAPYVQNEREIGEAIDAIRSAVQLANTFGFQNELVVLVGFSQGGCLVAEYLMTGNPLPAAAAIFTGCLPDLRNRDVVSNLEGLPVIISGGAEDPWLPIPDLIGTKNLLERAGAEVRFTQLSDGDHLVRPSEIAALGELAKKVAA